MAKISLGITELDSSQGSLVLGCPGSGKTSSIVKLVAALEKEGFGADEILVLTPSRLAANLLRDQIGVNSSLAAGAPRARSLSSFAFGLVSQTNPDLKLLSGASQQALIANLIQEAVESKQHLGWGVDSLTTELQGFQAEVRDLLAVVIENRLLVEDLERLQAQFSKTKLKVAIDLLPKYQALLKAQNSMDPSELLIRAIEQFTQEDQPRCLIVDDAQDLSPAGLRLVSKIASGSLSYIFGDPDAAVLGFRSGADSFLSHFPLPQTSLPSPVATELKLTLLNRISNRIPTGLAVAHRPKSQAQVNVAAQLFENQSAEADWLAAKLRRAKLIDEIGWDDMAVIARTRTQLDQLASDLSARSVPVRIIGVQQALKNQAAARSVLDFGNLVYAEVTEQDLDQLLTSPLVGLDA
uniref:UvrD-helicase domain-containing protein n=1 Tax=Aquiluna sp. TaxID=2053504 RepID=UPI00404818DF